MPTISGSSEQAGVGRRLALDDLQVQRQRDQATEHAHADDEVQDAGQAEHGVAEQPQRQQRVVAASGARRRTNATMPTPPTTNRPATRPNPSPSPGPARPRPAAARRRGRARARPSSRSCWSTRLCGQVEDPAHHDQRDHADRDVDAGTPSASRRRRGCESWPAKKPPSTGPSTLDGAEHGQEVALVLGPLPRRDDVADDGEGQRHQATGADALEGAERRQLVHRRATMPDSTEPTRKIEIADR